MSKKQEHKRKLGRFRINIFRAKKQGDQELVGALEKKRRQIKQLAKSKKGGWILKQNTLCS